MHKSLVQIRADARTCTFACALFIGQSSFYFLLEPAEDILMDFISSSPSAPGRPSGGWHPPPPPNFPKVSKTKQRRDGDGFKMAAIHRERSVMCEECESSKGRLLAIANF
jgi:hypothetical protein